MNPNAELRGHLLELYHGKGYVVFRLPYNSNSNGLDDIVKVNSPPQFFVGSDYIALPSGFAQSDIIDLLADSVTNYANLEVIALIFRTTSKGIIVQEVGTQRELEFTYFEFINAVERLPNANGTIKNEPKNTQSPNNSRLRLRRRGRNASRP